MIFNFKNNSKVLPSTTFALPFLNTMKKYPAKYNLRIAKGLKRESGAGFTMVEILVVVTIFALLSAILISNFPILQRNANVDTGREEIIGVLKLAQSKAMTSEGDSLYGVYFDTVSTPQKYILFKGASYATRDISFDQTFFLPKRVVFSSLQISPAGSQVVFNKMSGTSQHSAYVSVLSTNSPVNITKQLYVSNAGNIGVSSAFGSDSSRIKDSRHIDFTYNRVIDTATESLVFNFDGGTVVRTFPISSYMVSGQIKLNETVLVGGTNQTIELHTKTLNLPTTEFSIRRDRRLNDKSLIVTISGDVSGNLISYAANGSTVNGRPYPSCWFGAVGLSPNVVACFFQ